MPTCLVRPPHAHLALGHRGDGLGAGRRRRGRRAGDRERDLQPRARWSPSPCAGRSSGVALDVGDADVRSSRRRPARRCSACSAPTATPSATTPTSQRTRRRRRAAHPLALPQRGPARAARCATAWSCPTTCRSTVRTGRRHGDASAATAARRASTTRSGDIDVAGFCGFSLQARARERRRRRRAGLRAAAAARCARRSGDGARVVPPGRYQVDAESASGRQRVRGLDAGDDAPFPIQALSSSGDVSRGGPAVIAALEPRPPPRARARSAAAYLVVSVPHRVARRARRCVALVARRRAERRLDRAAAAARRRGGLPAARAARPPRGQPLARHAHPAAAGARAHRAAARGGARWTCSPTAACGGWSPLLALKPLLIAGAAASSRSCRWSLLAELLQPRRRRASAGLGRRSTTSARGRSARRSGSCCCALALPAGGARRSPTLDALGTRAVRARRARCWRPRAAPSGPVREMLAESLGDRSVAIAYWLPDRERFVDEAGRPVDAARARARGARGRRSSATGAASRRSSTTPRWTPAPSSSRPPRRPSSLAIDNERLKADLRARVEELRVSRLRIVEAADDARRRIERDLHDGAQQQLVALALDLRAAARRGSATPRPGRWSTGSRSGSPPRSPSCASSPAASTRRSSPTAAWRRRSTRSPTALAGPGRRATSRSTSACAAPVEAAAYFVVAEALTNVARYARGAAARASRCARDGDGSVVVVVADDGVGGADLERRQRPARAAGPPRGGRRRRWRSTARRAAARACEATIPSPREHGVRRAAAIAALALLARRCWPAAAGRRACASATVVRHRRASRGDAAAERAAPQRRRAHRRGHPRPGVEPVLGDRAQRRRGRGAPDGRASSTTARPTSTA